MKSLTQFNKSRFSSIGQMKKKRPEKAQKCKRKFRKDEKSCKIGILQMKRPILQKAGDRGWKAKGSI